VVEKFGTKSVLVVGHAAQSVRLLRLAKMGDQSPELRNVGGTMTVEHGGINTWPRVSVIIPALNEALNLPHVLARIPPDAHEVILVDGFSIDGTVDVARRLRPDLHVVRQSRSGKGNALACGFSVATGEIIAMIDADGSADPQEIPRFVEALVSGADFAKGSRFADGGRSEDITRVRSLGNRLLTIAFNICYSADYSDLCYGFNVFWRRHASVLGLDANSPPPADGNGRLWGDGFEIETLIHIRMVKARLVVAEIASVEHERLNGVSNLNAVSDGFRVLATIITERRHSRRKAAATPGVSQGHVSRRAASPVNEARVAPSFAASEELS
jgi:glycosyltransferase involved in cell wall biosynthesis